MDNNKIVEFTLDKKRNLLFNYKAMVSYERATGKSFFKFLGTVQASGIFAEDLQALIWAGCLHEDPTLQLEIVGELLMKAIGEGKLNDIQLKLLEAMTANLYTPSDGDKLPLESNLQK